MELYPLKFKPILKERIWGGKRLNTRFGKDLEGKENIGESWELSAVEDNISVVGNGFLEGNDLQEMIEIYMGELVGEKVYEKYGLEFPILIKLIDANDDLSIQVHPDDETAKEKHNSYGKTEMWFALDDSEKPRLITGFIRNTNKEEFLEKLDDNTLTSIFNYENVSKGDVFFVPAGRVHAICSGNLIVEIQQTSDVTYRIYDYNRLDNEGISRELHLELALDVMDYKKVVNPKVKYTRKENEPVELVRCNYFTTNLIELSKPTDRDYYSLDSFVILICTNGKCNLEYNSEEQISLSSGETILIPASLNSLKIIPLDGGVSLLEVYID